MNKQMIMIAVLMLGIGVGAGVMFAPSQQAMDGSTTQGKAEKEVLFYRNPMNPAITSPVPAKDEMGMDYIPVYADGGNHDHIPVGTVTIDPTLVQNMGVRTSKAIKHTLSHDIHTVGRITYDEASVTVVYPKYEGWVEKVFVDKTGEHVSRDTMLLSIYSPQLVATQEEYILALKNADMLKDSPFKDVRDGAASLVASALERLQLLDVPAHQIKQLNQMRKPMKGLHIHSPVDGTVITIGARDGKRITPNTELYKIADLSHVWVLVDVYEDDIPWVSVGDEANMQVAGIPGRMFQGKVSFIYPYLEAKTRTLKVRLEFDNPKQELKPEMFANVSIKASKQFNAVVVPVEAIVRTGKQDQVFIQRDAGKFEPRQVVLGVEADGLVQVLSGIEVGEEVVTSGQFLIDSESKLKEATAKMLEPQRYKGPKGNMHDMQMDDMDMQNMRMDDMDMQHQHGAQ